MLESSSPAGQQRVYICLGTDWDGCSVALRILLCQYLHSDNDYVMTFRSWLSVGPSRVSPSFLIINIMACAGQLLDTHSHMQYLTPPATWLLLNLWQDAGVNIEQLTTIESERKSELCAGAIAHLVWDRFLSGARLLGFSLWFMMYELFLFINSSCIAFIMDFINLHGM